ncbi:MAG: hypothetical protein AAFS10_14685 [Myxococcota bacterium]
MWLNLNNTTTAWCLFLILFTSLGACKPSQEAPTLTWPSPTQYRNHRPNDTDAVVPPLTEKDTVRLRYMTPDREHGVMEAGSWAATAIVRIANRVDSEGCFLTPKEQERVCNRLPQPLSKRLADRWMGDDGQPWTRDDRPIPDIHTLTTTIKPDMYEWGHLLAAARRRPPLPREPRRWAFIEGLVLTRTEARHLLDSLNTCPLEVLHHKLKLTQRARTSLATHRPFEDLETLAEASGVDRRFLIRVAHHVYTLDCGDQPPPPPIDSVELWVESHPQAQHWVWLYTPTRLDELVSTIRRSPNPKTALDREAQQRLRRPLTKAPRAQPDSEEPQALRALASEHVVWWLQHHRTDVDWIAVGHDLAGLRGLETNWAVGGWRGIWLARGWYEGERLEVRYVSNAGQPMTVRVVGGTKTNPSDPKVEGFD